MVRRWLIGLVIAIVAALVVFFIAQAAGDDLLVQPPGQAEQSVEVPFVIAATVFGAIGALLAALLIRLTPRPRITFVVVAVVALLLSFIQPFTAADTATALWLNLMHVAVAVPLIWFLANALPERRQARAAV